jgi:hypothetical protein
MNIQSINFTGQWDTDSMKTIILIRKQANNIKGMYRRKKEKCNNHWFNLIKYKPIKIN